MRCCTNAFVFLFLVQSEEVIIHQGRTAAKYFREKALAEWTWYNRNQ